MQDTRQKIMSKIYPVILFMGKVFGAKAKTLINQQHIKNKTLIPLSTIILNTNKTLNETITNHKKLLIVNTASGCGYTPQYAELQQLQNKYSNLLIIAFPANDFQNQETKNDADIATFCKINYGVSFPIAQKAYCL